VKTNSKSLDRKQFVWPVVGIAIGVLARTNPFYSPQITLEVGLTAWLVEMVLVLILSLHPVTARVGVLVAGLFLPVPCFLGALPIYRFFLMCGMAFTFAAASLQLFPAPTAAFRGRLAYAFTWLGTREVKRRVRSFDTGSLRQIIFATLVLAAAIAVVKAVSASGLWLLARWLAGGILLFAFAEVLTAGHYFITALMGVSAPPIMKSPYLSASLREFWAERWNPATSALVFGKFFFAPLARRGVGLGVFAAFFGSAVAHVLLLFMATKRWGISLMWGIFFLIQPLLIAVERWMKVRRWQLAAGRLWALTALAITSPLLVEPLLQLCEPSWGTSDDLLRPTLQVVGLAISMNIFVSLGSLASIRDLPSPKQG
jgi:hypothetical protein